MFSRQAKTAVLNGSILGSSWCNRSFGSENASLGRHKYRGEFGHNSHEALGTP